MVFRKLMSAFGAGVEVDTILTNRNVTPGGQLTGEVRFVGGKNDHDVEGINLELVANVEVESGDSEYHATYDFYRTQVSGPFRLVAGVQHAVPFQLTVPWETPVSAIGGHQLYGMKLGVHTELKLAGAMDKGDLDPLLVNPLPSQAAILQTFDKLGFRFHKADLEQGTLDGSRMPFFQEIEYLASPEFSRSFRELELTFIADERAVDVILEVDKRGGFLSAGHDAYNRFSIAHSDASGDLTGLLRDRLARMSQRH